MRVIYGKRGSGKTTRLIQQVKEFGGVLVVSSRSGLKQLLTDDGTLAKDQVITFQEKRNAGGDGRRYWIDDLNTLLEEMFGLGCEGFSMDDPIAITEMTFNQ